MDNQTLYLLDGASLCYRAFFAINLSTSKGLPTGAIYGFYNTFRKIKKKFHPKYLGVCFDVSRKTFRQEKFKEYKITRPPVPDPLKTQLPLVRELIGYLGVKIWEREGYEADDIIASVARRVPSSWKVVIVTSDKDLYQLIEDERITIYDPVKDKMITEKEFCRSFGFVPQGMVDYLALMGDASDNIPGARGIGKVTAGKLIQNYGSIEAVFEHVNDVSPSVKKKLIESKDAVFLSKELVHLAQVPMDFAVKDFKISGPDTDKLCEMFKTFEFKSFLKEIDPVFPQAIEIKKDQGLSEAIKKKIIAAGECMLYAGPDHLYVSLPQGKASYEVDASEIEDILDDERIKKICYDGKSFLRSLGIKRDMGPGWFDVKIAAHLVSSGLGDFSLENLVQHFIGDRTGDLAPSDYPYFIGVLYPVLKKQLTEYNLEDLFYSVEMPLVGVLADIESCGIRVDKKFLTRFSQEVRRKVDRLRGDIFEQAGHEFNMNSPQQLQRVLFEDLKLTPIKRTKTGYSTNEEVLLKLKRKHPIIPLILDYREYNKLYTTYLSPFLKQVEESGEIIHARFHQTGTQTGRLSSSSPNIQNLPARSDFTQQFRKAFISSFPGGIILSCDYSQIELRILAHFSGDEHLCEAFRTDSDVHRYTASLLFGRSQEKISSPQREVAKMVNFGIIYGMSSFRLARELNMSFEEADGFIAEYFIRYPMVKEFIEKIYRQVEQEGLVRTLKGRIRFLPDINSPHRELREFAHRQAVNTPIQGSAADIIKMAMVGIHRQMKSEKIDSNLIAQIHDELIFDVRKDELSKVKEIAQKEMEHVVSLNVPLKVNVKQGPNWFELKSQEE